MDRLLWPGVFGVAAGVGMVGLIRGARWAHRLYLVALGMLLYTAIISPGYFLQEGQPGFLVMFIVILVLAAVCLIAVVRGDSRRGSDAD